MADLSRAEQILALRAEGLTYAEIGARLGISKQRAHQVATAGERARVRAEIRELAEQIANVRREA